MLDQQRVVVSGNHGRSPRPGTTGERSLHTEIFPGLSVRSSRAYPPEYVSAVDFRNGFYRSYIACMRAFLSLIFGELRPLRGWERFGIDIPRRR